jgi:ABC-type spermidine/putrescine transport system permease subunit I
MLRALDEALLRDLGALRQGRVFAPTAPGTGWFSLPLLVCLVAALVSMAFGLGGAENATFWAALARLALVSAVVAAICLAVALPLALLDSPLWLLPLVGSLFLPADFWHHMPAAPGQFAAPIRAVILTLPWAIFWWRSALRRVPTPLTRAAAASGAGPFACFRLVQARLVLTAAWQGWALGFCAILGLALSGLLGA